MIYVTIKQQIMHLYIVNSTNCANMKEVAVFSGSANLGYLSEGHSASSFERELQS